MPHDYQCVQQLLGSGTETTTHASDTLVLDEEGIYRNVKAGHPLWKGGRIVTNLLDESNDFSGWTQTLNIASKTYTDGATKITSNSTSTPLLEETITTGLLAGRRFIWSVYLWTDAGQPTDAKIALFDSTAGDYVELTVALTTTPQRFSVQNLFLSSETDTAIDVRIGLSTVATGYLYANKGQLEESTGRSDQVTPSEYVETSGSEVTEGYASSNGNSWNVTSGLVTEAAGTVMTDLPYLHYQKAATNSCLYNRDFSNAVWTQVGTLSPAQNETGIDGVANRASTLTDNDGAGYEYIEQDVTIADDSARHTCVMWIKKDSDTSRFPLLAFNFTGGSTGLKEQFYFNTSTGATLIRSGNNDGSHEVALIGDFWRIIFEMMNNSTGNTIARPFTGVAWSTSWGVDSTAATGSIICDCFGVFLNADADDIRDVGPIVTTSASAMTNETIYTWAAANHSDTEGAYYVEVDWQGGDTDIIVNDGTAILYIEEALGPELITNGDFATDLSGWTYDASYYQWTSGTMDAYGTGAPHEAYQSITTEIGAMYEVSVDCTGVTLSPSITIDNVAFKIADLVDYNNVITPTNGDAVFTNGAAMLRFIATATSHSIGFFSVNAIFKADNMSVKKVIPTLTLDDGTNTSSVSVSGLEGELRIGFAYGSANMRLNLEDIWQTAATYDGGFGTGSITTKATIRELKRKDATYANAQIWLEEEFSRENLDYLLNATFIASNQTFTASQVLDTQAEGVSAGSMTVVDSGSITYVKIVSNELELKGNDAWNESGLREPTGHTKTIGLAWMLSVEVSSTSVSSILPRWADGGDLTQTQRLYQWHLDASGLLGFATYSPSDTAGFQPTTTGMTYSANTQVPLAIVCGGYNSSGEAYKAGDTKSSFAYGACFFRYDGANWLLEWRETRDNTTPVHFGIVQYSSTSISKSAYAKIPDKDFADILVPSVLDTFTDTNGTALASHTPDVDTVGNGWVQHTGSADIQSNEYNSGTSPSLLTIDSGEADAVIECDMTANTGATSNAGLVFRYVDGNNLWLANIAAAATDITLYEVVGGTWTSRGTVSSLSITGRLVVLLNGSSIVFHKEGPAGDFGAVAYTSTSHQTSTLHGLRYNDATTGRADNFAVFPRGNGGEYNDFNAYT